VDLLVRAVDPQPGEKIIDPACGAGGFLAAVSRHFRKNGASASEVAKAARNFYGVEKDSYLARLARLHVSLLTRGHVGIRCGDSLALVGENGTSLKDNMPVEGYDVLLTNPPFGANIVSANPDVLRTFDLAKRWHEGDDGWEQRNEIRSQVPPQVLFVERCLKLVKPNGKIGMVLPESVLSNKSYRYVVAYLRKHATPEAIIGMPEDLFKTSGKGGTHTKTCLLVLRKGVAMSKRLFMAEAQWCGHDSRARDIPYDDLPGIGDAFAVYRSGKRLKPSHIGFTMDLEAITDNVLCPRYYNPELDEEIENLRATHELVTFGALLEDGTLDIATGHEVGKLAYGSGEVPFVRTSDISNWEIKCDPKHLVDREIFKSLEKKQDVRENDILMVKDGTYLVGTCAIVTEYDREIIYQSHLYKIRVLKTNRLSAHLLLAILSSSIVQRQIKAKRFTQDIIDSLGERIKELILPIPKDAAKRKNIDDMVRHVVIARVKARELARQARVEVLT
jgi:type I restriction enzyme M protein